MNGESWYELTQGTSLYQGDLLLGYPISEFVPDPTIAIGAAEVAGNLVATDLVVMTQTCDLENNKVSHVLLAQSMPWQKVVRDELKRGNTAIKSKDFRKKLVEGNVPGLSLLHRHEGTPTLEWSVVNFHRLFTLPTEFVTRYALSVGPRLRLRSPYREHLAQAFARYFMRVGLPHDAKAFEKEGDVSV